MTEIVAGGGRALEPGDRVQRDATMRSRRTAGVGRQAGPDAVANADNDRVPACRAGDSVREESRPPPPIGGTVRGDS